MTTQNLQLIEPPDFAIPVAAAEMRETFRVLDALGAGWMAVLSASTTTPPTNPPQGATYRVPEGATGAWAGHAKHLAIYTQVGWVFRPPRLGWIALVLDANAPYGRVEEYTGTAWVPWLLPAVQVAYTATGTSFVSDNLQDLRSEIDTSLEAAGDILTDHESRIDAIEAGGASGGGPVLLGSHVLNGSTSATLDVSSISQAYTHLMLVFAGRGDAAGQVFRDVYLNLNGDSGNNYDQQDAHFVSNASGLSQSIGQSKALFISTMPAASATANRSATAVGFIPYYKNTTFDKQGFAGSGFTVGTGGFNVGVGQISFNWRPATPAAVTQVTLSPQSGNFVDKSALWVYGI